MSMGRSIATFWAIVLFAAPAGVQAQFPAQTPSASPSARPARPAAPLSSHIAAARFLEIGREMARMPGLTGPQADQAIIFLTAAKSLNNQLPGVEPLLLKLAARHSTKDYSEPVIFWLQKYVNESADRVIVADALRYLQSRAKSREQRKALLERVAEQLRNKNPAINSELALSLGLLMLEQGATEQAKWYLVQAYNNNKFNRAAFDKLAEIAPNEIGPATNLEYRRLLIRENPLDLNEALAFAGYAEQLQLYDVAAQSYQYCAELFRYLYPSEPLPPHIYLPWAISCHNSTQGLPVCLEIAGNIRTLNRFDILLEAVAGRAALKMGMLDEARQIFSQAEQTAEELLSLGQGQLQGALTAVVPVRPASARQLAWFHCFANPDPAKALDWANKAYSAEPNSPSAAALLAYAFSLNNQLEWARPLLESAEQSQIADLVKARVQMETGNRAEAIQTIKAAVAKDAGSLAAERAKDILRQLGSPYTPPIETKALVAFLTEHLGNAVVPRFTPPDQMIDVQFSVRNATLGYGNEIDGVVTLVNRGSEPLVITDNSLFQGNLRVSAQVTGSLTRDLPNLLSETIRTSLTLLPGKSLVQTLRLSTGELRDLLLAHPQASLDIQFTLYLDPVATDTGAISNRLVDLKPLTTSLRRPGVQVTMDLVRSRLNTVASAPETQRIQTARLFTGLLKEQYVMAEQGTLYNFYYDKDGVVTAQLRLSLTSASGLLLGGADGGWAVRVNTMADMLFLPLDHELANAAAKNLTHSLWPVRLMAIYLLARGPAGSFSSVLDWVAQKDPDELVRSLAISLQSASQAALTPLLSAPQPGRSTLP